MSNEIINELDQLFDQITDDCMESEEKIGYLYDKDFSVNNIRKDVVSNKFEEAIDKLKGLNQALGLGESITDIISLIEEH